MPAIRWTTVLVLLVAILCLLPSSASGQPNLQRRVPTPFGGVPQRAVAQTANANSAVASTQPDMIYMDCYTEAEHSAFHVLDVQFQAVSRAMFKSPSQQQPSTCAQACWKAGYPYLGVKGYYQCWCGKDVTALHFQRGKCMACLGSFRYRCGKKDTIAVYKINQVPPRASICQSERTAVAGVSVTFQCLGTGDEPIQFMWQLPKFNARASVSGGSLTIHDVRRSDNGIYVCTAKNPYIGMPSLRTSNASATLTVQTPPRSRIAVVHPFIVGQSAALLCMGSGDAPLQLSWQIGSVTISKTTLNTDRLSITHDRMTARTMLTFKNVSLEDQGYFYCDAANDHILDISQRSHRASFRFNLTADTASSSEATTAGSEAGSQVTTEPQHVQQTSQPRATTTALYAGAEMSDQGGFFGLGIDNMTLIAVLCGVCAVLLLVLTVVVCYWQRRKMTELDEKQHTHRLSTGQVLGLTGSYLYPSISDTDSNGGRGSNTLESSMSQQPQPASDKVLDGDACDVRPGGVQDMCVVEEDPNVNLNQLDPISTSYFESGLFPPTAAGGTFFTNPAMNLDANTCID